MFSAADIGRFTIVTGHYGSGKTNFSLNLARDLARRFDDVSLVDLDIVNPYFRSSDYTELLQRLGVSMVAPTFAGTTTDVPSLSSGVYAAIDSPGGVVLDVGGDDVGATALGRFATQIAGVEHEMLYVINRYRNLTARPAEAAALLGEIEAASHLRATGVVNNSNLGRETTLETVLDSLEFARETAELLHLPLVCTTVPVALSAEVSEMPGTNTYVENAFPVEIYVRPPWEDPAAGREDV